MLTMVVNYPLKNICMGPASPQQNNCLTCCSVISQTGRHMKMSVPCAYINAVDFYFIFNYMQQLNVTTSSSTAYNKCMPKHIMPKCIHAVLPGQHLIKQVILLSSYSTKPYEAIVPLCCNTNGSKNFTYLVQYSHTV